MTGLSVPTTPSSAAPAASFPDPFALFETDVFGSIGDVWGIFGGDVEEAEQDLGDPFADFLADRGLPVERAPVVQAPMMTIAQLAQIIKEQRSQQGLRPATGCARHALPASAKGRKKSKLPQTGDLFGAPVAADAHVPVASCAPRPGARGPLFPGPDAFSAPRKPKAAKKAAPVPKPVAAGQPHVEQVVKLRATLAPRGRGVEAESGFLFAELDSSAADRQVQAEGKVAAAPEPTAPLAVPVAAPVALGESSPSAVGHAREDVPGALEHAHAQAQAQAEPGASVVGALDVGLEPAPVASMPAARPAPAPKTAPAAPIPGAPRNAPRSAPSLGEIQADAGAPAMPRRPLSARSRVAMSTTPAPAPSVPVPSQPRPAVAQAIDASAAKAAASTAGAQEQAAAIVNSLLPANPVQRDEEDLVEFFSEPGDWWED